MANRDYIPNTMFKIEPLNANNWLKWKQLMMALFQDRHLDRYVDRTIPRLAQVGTTVDPTIAAEQLAWGTETRKTVKHKQHACISQTSTYERQETANRIRRQPEPGC